MTCKYCEVCSGDGGGRHGGHLMLHVAATEELEWESSLSFLFNLPVPCSEKVQDVFRSSPLTSFF